MVVRVGLVLVTGVQLVVLVRVGDVGVVRGSWCVVWMRAGAAWPSCTLVVRGVCCGVRWCVVWCALVRAVDAWMVRGVVRGCQASMVHVVWWYKSSWRGCSLVLWSMYGKQ